ncbi:MAG: sigma-54-dependent Fis family transcriptional regulator [Bacteriovoracaceae bacterium]|nr:sigma-54-dependent Fis family transcriptional regulator [Bacteriovoracaceae bacterium]
MLEKRMAMSDQTLLITGPTGSGKSRKAKQIHQYSSRRNRAFVHVNLCNFTQALFESELFGHVRGAFTGAIGEKNGFLKAVGDGTLFLDEVGDMALETQAKLLMVLEEGIYYPVGSTSAQSFKGRIVFATNKNLEEMVAQGTFREDLFFRLRTFELNLVALQSVEKIEEVIEDFFLDSKKRANRPELLLGTDTLAKLSTYEWPGNYRELKNVMDYAVAMGDAVINVTDLPSYLNHSICSSNTTEDYHQCLESFEKRFLIRMLEKREFRINKTSREIKISKVTLLSKIKKYDIKVRRKKTDYKEAN